MESESLPTFLQSLGEYPRWFVIACLTVIVAALLWVMAKVLKWTIYLLVALVVLGGGVAAVWYWLN